MFETRLPTKPGRPQARTPPHAAATALSDAVLAAAVLLAAVAVTARPGASQLPAPDAPAAPRATTTTPIEVRAIVHPGMELITIMLWMAGRYPPPVDSLYKTAVWEHFRDHRDDPALEPLRAAKAMYPDFTEAGWLLRGGPTDWDIDLPDACSWYEVIDRDQVAAILEAAPKFAAASDYAAFVAGHRERYTRWGREMEEMLSQHQALEALDRFYRYGAARPRPQVTVCLEPLNGWGAHAILFERLKGEPNGRRVTFQTGPSGGVAFPDTALRFASARSMLGTIWHEGSHVYLHPVLAAHEAAIAGLKRLFNADDLRSQNIRTWSYCFEENVVRSCVAALLHLERGDAAARDEMRTQVQRGFLYVPTLTTRILDEYVAQPERFADFDAFFPRLLEALEPLQTPSDAPGPPTGRR
ncbi:MAG: DUF4932 domain-containing protein [Planctomycetota bacterium]